MGTITRSFANLITAGGPSAVADGSITVADLVSGAVVNTPAFRAKLSSTQAISHNAATLLAFATEDFDTDSAFDNTGGNYRFTVPSGKAGKYCFQFHVRASNFTTSRENIGIRKNGVEFMGFENGSGSVYDSISGVVLLDLTDGDYIDATFYHNTGYTVDLLVETHFSGFKLI